MSDTPPEEDAPQKMLWASSLVGAMDGKPKVDITIPDGRVQLSYDEAVRFGTSILECAEAAMGDAFVFHMMTKTLRLTPEVAARIIQEFREFRDELSRMEDLRKS